MRAPSKPFVIAVLPVITALGTALGAALGTALIACGGASDSPPGPLAKHFDDLYIAAIPLEQKQSVIQAQNEWSIARFESAKAEADYKESATQVEIAHNDLKAAKLGIDSAVSSKKSAEASADTNRINQATKDLHTAEDAAKAAEARVKYLESYRNYLKVGLRHAQENMYWREARYELAKAQLGQQNSIAPKGVSYETFPQQEQERSSRTAAAKARLDTERQRALSARESWMKAQEIADRETGRTSRFPDPMAPRPAATAGEPEPAATAGEPEPAATAGEPEPEPTEDSPEPGTTAGSSQ